MLIVSDLRIVYLPTQIYSPLWAEQVELDTDSNTLTDEQQLALQRYTYQLPLSAVNTIVATPLNTSTPSTTLSILAKDGGLVEFVVKQIVWNSNNRSGRKKRVAAMRFDELHVQSMKLLQEKLSDPIYAAGIATDGMDPYVWCSRVVEYVEWETREDRVWLRWAKYLKKTCFQDMSSRHDKSWLAKSRHHIEVGTDYQRIRVQDSDWKLSDLNFSYNLCVTYPQLLVFPQSMDDETLIGAASERSRARLSALVWLHPLTRAPLCRASQPKAGLSGNSIEFDKKLCLAIRQACPSGLPLRIADARPKLNANANAMQGKGFESISFLGGSSVASLVFLDIENIHVMRQTLGKLRECFATGLISGGVENIAEFGANGTKWLCHIAAVLKGAAGLADSLMIGYPVLVHCSDGW